MAKLRYFRGTAVLEAITSSKARLFWALHFGGWATYAALNYLVGMEVTGKPPDYIIPSVLYAVGGIGITGCLRLLFRAVWELRPLPLMAISAIGSIAASSLFTGFRSLVFILYYERSAWGELTLPDFFNLWDLYISLYVIGTWSGLYFGINYYHMVQQQGERLLRVSNAAVDAQLKMLRYQLNPHFLFNTLNAVTTLILEGDREAASSMVTRLSAFLRHSLANDPSEKVTLAEELKVLDLYLSIEQARFEDLLAIERNIEPAALQGLVPGMLLQPVIENAITREIAGAEEGGTISIAGFIEDGKLCLRIADTAHGDSETDPASAENAYAGFDSMRERLSVLYGDGHDLRLNSLEPNGLGVTISIPLEYSSPQIA